MDTSPNDRLAKQMNSVLAPTRPPTCYFTQKQPPAILNIRVCDSFDAVRLDIYIEGINYNI